MLFLLLRKEVVRRNLQWPRQDLRNSSFNLVVSKWKYKLFIGNSDSAIHLFPLLIKFLCFQMGGRESSWAKEFSN